MKQPTLLRSRISIVLLCLACLAGIPGSAQRDFQVVDRNKIDALVDDASLATFYPILLDRFNAFDKTLTLREYRLLYYGFVFQPTYSEYADQKKKEMNRAFAAEKYDLVIRIADSILKKIPISLSANYFRGCAMFSLNEKDASHLKYINRYKRLRDAILSSGNGKQCNTGFKTIYFADQYDIMHKYFEITGNAGEHLPPACDRFVTSPTGTYQNTEIFFDSSESVLSMQKELRSHASR
jgi:hypothetical protein